MGLGILRVGSGITSRRTRIGILLKDQGSGLLFLGSGTKMCHTFGIKDQKFGYRNVMVLMAICLADRLHIG